MYTYTTKHQKEGSEDNIENVNSSLADQNNVAGCRNVLQVGF